MAEKRYISQITLPNGITFDIKDAAAWAAIERLINAGISFKISTNAATTPAGVKWMDDETEIIGTLTASSVTKANVYLVPHVKDHSGDVDYYREYVTVNFGTEESPTWVWEFLGTTDIDISNLGALAYKDSASGSVSVTEPTGSGTFSNGTASVSATYTPAGSVSVTLGQTATAADLTRADYTPAGSVSKPNVTVTPSTETVEVKKTSGSVTPGSAASFTRGSFSGGSFTQGTDSFSAGSFSATVAEGTEILTISFTAPTFSQGSDSFTPASHGDDTFSGGAPTQVTLPTFEEKTVMTGATAELDAAPTFTGTKETGLKVTAASYDKASVASQSFTGTEATINSTGTAAGDVTVGTQSNSKTVTVS